MEENRKNDSSIDFNTSKKNTSKISDTTSDNTLTKITSNTSTHFYKEGFGRPGLKKTTLKEFLSETESLSVTTSIPCYPKKKYSQKGLLKRNLIKNLDRLPDDPKWIEGCTHDLNWSVISFLDGMVDQGQGSKSERFEQMLNEFVMLSANGFRFEYLDCISKILDYLLDHNEVPYMKKCLSMLLINCGKPIILDKKTDILTHFQSLQGFFTVLGCLLLILPDDNDFDVLYNALVWQLTTCDKMRGPKTIRKCDIMNAATPVLIHAVTRMIALSSSRRYLSYVEIAMILSCYCFENCINLLEENIIESILCRYNPYYPHRELPCYEIGPASIGDYKIKLGDSTLHSHIVLSLLLVLLKNAIIYLEKYPEVSLPLPSSESIKCFAWAFRYECRVYDRRHERITMCVICSALLKCYGRRLPSLATILMADVLSLSICTEVPIRTGWIKRTSFNKSALDVQFKKNLLYLSVNFIKAFPENKFMVDSQYWLMGLLYLLDPALTPKKHRWSPALFQELHVAAIQTLTCILHIIPPNMIKQYGLLKRLLWYVEWYSLQPYEIRTLYWTLRVLYSALRKRKTQERNDAIRNLFDSHGFILLSGLCHTLLDMKYPINEKSQVILALTLRMLTSSVESTKCHTFEDYPKILWTDYVNNLGFKALNIVMYSLERGFMICDRFLISLMNFIWESIIWDENYRTLFVSTNGIYKLLDLVAMTNAPVQCIVLAVLCDLVRGSNSIAELITWRAKLHVDEHSNSVKHGSTIITLLASIYRDDCRINGIILDENGVIQDVDNPLMSMRVRNIIFKEPPREMVSRYTPISYTASDLAGSRASKVFALLHLLREDLKEKVNLADEKYNLYKNVELECEDEVIMTLCLHHLTAKIQEAWAESTYIINEIVEEDKTVLEEFLQLGKGWAIEIKKCQEEVLRRARNTGKYEEKSLYTFLGRTRLCLALDSLREIRCVARTADRTILTHCLLRDAIFAHDRRNSYCNKMDTTILSTYEPQLDNQNLIGQDVKMKGKQMELPNTKKHVSKIF